MTTIGRYELLEVLGAGGMGVVHAAHDPRLDRRVAIKVMSSAAAHAPDFRARFDRETAMVARLDSPHVVEVYDHGEQDGTPYLVTRLVSGGDLASALRTRGPLPPRSAAAVCAQVAEALRDAHAAGVVHRDVKAANVLLADADAAEPWAYLCDFGIAAPTDADGGLTRTGAGAAGTWSHLAPERFDGAPGTPASDLYALGCLLWVCLTGRPPYTGGDLEVAEAHHVAPVPQLPRTPGTGTTTTDLNRVLAACLAKRPEDRPRDAEAVRTHLRAVAAGVPAPRLPTGRPRRPRRGALVAAAALGVAAVVGVAVTAVVLDGPSDPGPAEVADGGPPAPAVERVRSDADGDGYGDLLVQVGRGIDSSQLVFASDGRRFAEEPTLSDAGSGVSVGGDVDGDGMLDVVSVTFGRRALARTVLGTGRTSRRALEGVPTGADELTLSLADTDGDGRSDLLLSGADDDGLLVAAVAPSRADGTRGPLQPLDLPVETAPPVFLGDFDGDGAAEILQVRFDPSRPDEILARLLDRTGGTSYSSRGELRLPAIGPRDRAVVGDVDGDGADELLVLVERGSGDGRRSLRVVDPAERSVRVVSSVPQPASPDDLLVPVTGDFDGDGDDDVAVPRRQGDAFEVDVQLATPEGFDAPETWGVVRCGERCDDVTLLRGE